MDILFWICANTWLCHDKELLHVFIMDIFIEKRLVQSASQLNSKMIKVKESIPITKISSVAILWRWIKNVKYNLNKIIQPYCHISEKFSM